MAFLYQMVALPTALSSLHHFTVLAPFSNWHGKEIPAIRAKRHFVLSWLAWFSRVCGQRL